MEEPLTCAGGLEELALALGTELEPLAAQQLAEVLEMIRSSGCAGDFASTQAEVVHRVADRCWCFITAARGQGGFLWGGDLRDSHLTHGLNTLLYIVGLLGWLGFRPFGAPYTQRIRIGWGHRMVLFIWPQPHLCGKINIISIMWAGMGPASWALFWADLLLILRWGSSDLTGNVRLTLPVRSVPSPHFLTIGVHFWCCRPRVGTFR
jgi:hypothetical protein